MRCDCGGSRFDADVMIAVSTGTGLIPAGISSSRSKPESVARGAIAATLELLDVVRRSPAMQDRKPGRLPELSAGRPIPKLLENHPGLLLLPLR